jgi:hypothetical protein
MTNPNFTQIGVFGEDETITIKATYETWWTIVDDLRVGVQEFAKTVDEIEKGISPEDMPANAPYIKSFREAIDSRLARIDELNKIVEGEDA